MLKCCMRARWIVLLLVVLHMGFAAVFAWVTPYRTPGLNEERVYLGDIGAPDEAAHSTYVESLAKGNGIPHIYFDRKNVSYEAHQPPLYYALSAIWSRLVGIDDFQAQRSGFLLRLLNVLIGGIAVAGVCAFSFWGYRRKDIMFFAGAIAALLPSNVAAMGAISNDPLLFALASWTLALSVKASQNGWCWRDALYLGLLSGMGLLTKTSAVVFCIPILLAAFLTVKRPSWTMVLGCGSLAFLLVLPIWIRNYEIYHDPLMTRTFNQVSMSQVKNSILSAHSLRDVARILVMWLQIAGMSTIGLFGYMCIRLPLAIYLIGLSGIGFMGWGWARSLRGEEQKSYRSINHIGGWFFIGAFVAFAVFSFTYMQPQARYTFYAIGPVVVALSFGLKYWTKRFFVPYAIAVGVLLLLADCISISVMRTEFCNLQQNLTDAGGAQVFESK